MVRWGAFDRNGRRARRRAPCKIRMKPQSGSADRKSCGPQPRYVENRRAKRIKPRSERMMAALAGALMACACDPGAGASAAGPLRRCLKDPALLHDQAIVVDMHNDVLVNVYSSRESPD